METRTLSAPRARADLMDPAELSRLGGVEFIARQVVEGFLMGLHRSPHRGFSAEFAEHRAYQSGDDLRYIDWRMYGRSDRYYVKQFEEETNLRAYLLLDVSASMAWTSEPERIPPKIWYAKHLAASLALILLRQGDSVGLTALIANVKGLANALICGSPLRSPPAFLPDSVISPSLDFTPPPI